MHARHPCPTASLLPFSIYPGPPPVGLPAQPHTATPGREAGSCGECQRTTGTDSPHHRRLPGSRWPIRPHHCLTNIYPQHAFQKQMQGDCHIACIATPPFFSFVHRTYRTRGSNSNERVLLADHCAAGMATSARSPLCRGTQLPSFAKD